MSAFRGGDLFRLRVLHITLAQAIVLVTYVAIALLTILQVFTRYVMGDPLSWTEELARYSFMWLIFVGMVLSLNRGAHASVDILSGYCQGVSRKVVELAVHCISLALFAVMCYHGYLLFVMSSGQLSPAMRISIMVPYASLPFGCALMVIEEIFILAKILRSGTGGQA
jgi:TRAP-type C4-dicarboxylate transport system permease small subunit